MPNASSCALQARRKVSKAPLILTEVRSVRIKGKSRGFKLDACNPSKDCFCCVVGPPTLSGKVIRSLGRDFCKISVGQISAERLQKKNMTKKEAAVVQASQVTKKDNGENIDKMVKKSRMN
jgi:hypothetical protein